MPNTDHRPEQIERQQRARRPPPPMSPVSAAPPSTIRPQPASAAATPTLAERASVATASAERRDGRHRHEPAERQPGRLRADERGQQAQQRVDAEDGQRAHQQDRARSASPSSGPTRRLDRRPARRRRRRPPRQRRGQQRDPGRAGFAGRHHPGDARPPRWPRSRRAPARGSSRSPCASPGEA